MQKITQYKTKDGQLFDREADAIAYENNLKVKASDSYNKYLNTYSGKRLLEQHSLETVGLWMIYGEDPNCNLGGSHHTPHLATVSASLEEAIKYGVTLPAFWQWGGGGHFEKFEIT